MLSSTSRAAVAAVFALPLLLLGCGESATEPADDLAVTLDFNVSRPAFMPPFSTTRTGSTLVLRGRTDTACTPSTGAAQVARMGEVLVLTVDVTAGEGCAGSGGVANYDASITGIGRLTVFRVLHRWPGADREDVVAYESVWD